MNNLAYYDECAKSGTAPGINKLSPIDRSLEILTERINDLENMLDRVWVKTEGVRNTVPCGSSDPRCEHPSMSPVASRIQTNCERLRNLTESVERLISEIEL